jgi:transcriptional regulator with XRE-family HTH domain
MAERGYTQKSLSDTTHVARSTINLVLGRKRAPDLATLQEMLGPLGLDPLELVQKHAAHVEAHPQAPGDRSPGMILLPTEGGLPQEPAAADEVLRLTYQTVQRLEREVRLLREQLATYGVAPPQKEPEVSEEPSTPAGRPGDIVPADPRAPERAEEPDIFRMVREALDKLPGGHLIPLDPEKVIPQYKAPGPTTKKGLQSVVDFLAQTYRDDWLIDHGMDEDELVRRAREGRTLED